MKKKFVQSALSIGVLFLAACSGGNDASGEGATAKTAETAAADTAAKPRCTQESMMAKATELGEKMKGMASDPAAMQEMASKMQDIQAKIQQGTADGSFGIEEACAAYDELLAQP